MDQIKALLSKLTSSISLIFIAIIGALAFCLKIEEGQKHKLEAQVENDSVKAKDAALTQEAADKQEALTQVQKDLAIANAAVPDNKPLTPEQEAEYWNKK